MNGYNFSETVRRVLAMAREEAGRLNHPYVGTEHILYGIVRTGNSGGARLLDKLGASTSAISARLDGLIPNPGPTEVGPDLPYTSRSKKALEFSMGEARDLGHSYVGSEHLVLGLLREERGIAAQVLGSLGVTIDRARSVVEAMVAGEDGEGPAVATSTQSRPWRAARRHRAVSAPERFTPRAHAVIERARADALRRRQEQVETQHLLLALLQESGGMASLLLSRLGVDREALIRATDAALGGAVRDDAPSVPNFPLSEVVELALMAATEESLREGSRVGTDMILLTLLLSEKGMAAHLLRSAGVTAEGVNAERERVVG